jgi:hypothetical protein
MCWGRRDRTSADHLDQPPGPIAKMSQLQRQQAPENRNAEIEIEIALFLAIGDVDRCLSLFALSILKFHF